jgi:hypothetical protein
MQRLASLLVLILFTSVGSLHAQGGRGSGPQGPLDSARGKPPNISGTWAGTWSAYNPARATAPPKELCAKLTATIAQKGDAWQAVFEGDCGRPYKYTITMEGRQAGGAVLFKGTADLGPKDGGVYDWIGRADDKEFVGFFTSGFYTGVFTMTKAN